MDPVSAIAGITIAAATTLEAITNLVNRIQNGPKHVRELAEDIHNLKTYIQHAEEVLRVDGVSDSTATAAANGLLRTIRALNDELEQLHHRIKKGKNSGDKEEIQRLRWFLNEGKCQKLRLRIKFYREELSRSIELINLDYVRGLVKDARSSLASKLSTRLARPGEADGVENGEPEAPTTPTDPSLVSMSRSSSELGRQERKSSTSSDKTLVPINSASPTELAALSTSQTSPELDRQESKSSSSSDTTLVPTNSTTSTLERPRTAQNCGQFCRCKCHIKISHQWPHILRRSGASDVIGSISRPNFSYRCSDHACKSRHVVRAGTVYITPSWLRKKAVFVSIFLRGLKIERHIRGHNIVAETSDVARYAIKGDIDGLRRLFSQRLASVHDCTPDGWSLLHNAAYYGQLATTKFLLENSADIHASEINSRKAAHLAIFRSLKKDASENEKQLARMFPNADDFKHDFGLSPVHVAVLDLYDPSEKEKPGLVELLDFVDEANNASLDEDWSVWRARYRERSSLYMEIIERFQDPPKNHKRGTKVFYDLKNEPDLTHGWSPIHWAAFTGRFEQYKVLLDRGAYPYTVTLSGRNLFHQAAEGKSFDIIAHLIENCYHNNSLDINRPDIWKETPLHICAGKSAKCVSLLLKNGADVNALQLDNQVPLHFAQYAENQEKMEIVRILASQNNVDLEFRDAAGRTPVFDLLDSPECVKCLLDRGIKADIYDHHGKTLLHHACRENQPATLQILLSRCPQLVSYKDKNGDTPLNDAFSCAAPRCAMALLTAHPKIKYSPSSDRPDWTLLHEAAHLGDAEVLRHVLTLPGIDVHARTKQGHTAMGVAVAAGTCTGPVKELLMGIVKAQGLLKENLAGKIPTRKELKAKYK